MFVLLAEKINDKSHTVTKLTNGMCPRSDESSLFNYRTPGNLERGGVAQWIGRRISDQGVPSSIPRRCTFRCGLEQVTFALCLILVKPRKRWTDNRLGQTVTRLEITLCLMC